MRFTKRDAKRQQAAKNLSPPALNFFKPIPTSVPNSPKLAQMRRSYSELMREKALYCGSMRQHATADVRSLSTAHRRR